MRDDVLLMRVQENQNDEDEFQLIVLFGASGGYGCKKDERTRSDCSSSRCRCHCECARKTEQTRTDYCDSSSLDVVGVMAAVVMQKTKMMRTSYCRLVLSVECGSKGELRPIVCRSSSLNPRRLHHRHLDRYEHTFYLLTSETDI